MTCEISWKVGDRVEHDKRDHAFWRETAKVTRLTGTVIAVYPDGINVKHDAAPLPESLRWTVAGPEFIAFDDTEYGSVTKVPQ